ncbi:hypothetical protein [Micromonospora palomenae]|nr:hypothetical protein [Micromonospora palomenae]
MSFKVLPIIIAVTNRGVPEGVRTVRTKCRIARFVPQAPRQAD